MQDLNDKVTGNSLLATEWNQVPSELQNVIEALGITLSSGDLNQLGKAIAGYAANGQFYTDSGAADAYVLTTVGSKQSAPEYTDGFEAKFRPGNTNTGASTVNVAGIGVKNIKTSAGSDPAAGSIIAGNLTGVIYDLANDWFELTEESNLLRETTVPGAAVSSIDFTGLDINTHKSYRVEVEHVNPTGSDSTIEMFINGDTTLTNYDTQTLTASDVTLTGARQNNTRLATTLATSTGNYVAYVMRSNSRARVVSNGMNGDATTLRQDNRVIRKNTTDANITQITFNATVASSIGTGSVIRIYRGDK